MARRTGISLPELRGFIRLGFDATAGLIGLVEAMHANIARAPGKARDEAEQAAGVAGLVYRSARGAACLAGNGLDAVLAQLAPLLPEASPPLWGEAVRSAFNGIVGDHLLVSGNPLAIQMRLCHEDQPLRLERNALAAAIGRPASRLAVLVHGLCLNHRNWRREGHDHGAALAHDLNYMPLYLHYNSGLHISTNGREFATLLETLIREWPSPLDRFVIIGHSMGGLVTRSACHFGAEQGHNWLARLHDVIFLGTPHHGAPLERGGQWLDLLLAGGRYTAPFTRLGRIRSAGVTDLRHGNLLDTDWEGHDRFALRADLRRPVPLPDQIRFYAIAATAAREPGDPYDRVLGDGLVPVASALGLHEDPGLALRMPESRKWIGRAMNHFDLLNSQDVYDRIRSWLDASDSLERTLGEMAPALLSRQSRPICASQRGRRGAMPRRRG